MVTVQHLVKKELEKNPILIDMLQKKLVNISAAAARLLPAVENELGRKIKLSAVSMGVRRYAINVSQKPIFQYMFPKDLEISTKTQIYEVAIAKPSNTISLIKKLHKEIKLSKGEFVSVVEGIYEFLIFTNQSNKNIVKKILKGQRVTSEVDNAGYVAVNWERCTKDIPGIYYSITRSLAFKGISIQAFYTVGAEMMVFFKEADFMEAYQTISNLLKNKVEL